MATKPELLQSCSNFYVNSSTLLRCRKSGLTSCSGYTHYCEMSCKPAASSKCGSRIMRKERSSDYHLDINHTKHVNEFFMFAQLSTGQVASTVNFWYRNRHSLFQNIKTWELFFDHTRQPEIIYNKSSLFLHWSTGTNSSTFDFGFRIESGIWKMLYCLNSLYLYKMWDWFSDYKEC